MLKLKHTQIKRSCLKSRRKWQKRLQGRPSGAVVLFLTALLYCLSR